MENLEIQKTEQSPKIKFETNGNLYIEGVSTINYANKFYGDAVTWLENLKQQQRPEALNLILELYYLNTSSSLMLVEILRSVNSFKELNTKVRIEWRYEEDDEDILSFGEEVEVATNSKFEYVIL